MAGKGCAHNFPLDPADESRTKEMPLWAAQLPSRPRSPGVEGRNALLGGITSGPSPETAPRRKKCRLASRRLASHPPSLRRCRFPRCPAPLRRGYGWWSRSQLRAGTGRSSRCGGEVPVCVEGWVRGCDHVPLDRPLRREGNVVVARLRFCSPEPPVGVERNVVVPDRPDGKTQPLPSAVDVAGAPRLTTRASGRASYPDDSRAASSPASPSRSKRPDRTIRRTRAVVRRSSRRRGERRASA
jgi:hypothetical protein